MKKKKLKLGFTLAEVIITLIVIGVVAAITVPMLVNGTDDKKWNVGKQKALATIGEAFRMATINGEITTTRKNGSTMNTSDFVDKVLSKYLKLERTCTPTDYAKCGFPATIKAANGATVTDLAPSSYTWRNLSPAGVVTAVSKTASTWGTLGNFSTSSIYNTSYFFRTIDGFSVTFLYNPNCAQDISEYYSFYEIIGGKKYYSQFSMDTICLMGIYDMNGKKKPNQLGKDIGIIGSFYNGYGVKTAAVLPHDKKIRYNQTGRSEVKSWDKLYNYCDSIGKNHDWIMPDINELALLYLGKKLIDNSSAGVYEWFFSRSFMGGGFHASTSDSLFQILHFYPDWGGIRSYTERSHTENTSGPYVRCVRNNALK